MPKRPDDRIELTFDGITAAYTELELEELRSFETDARTPEEAEDAEWFARFVHKWKSIDPGAELVASGPRLTRGRYG